MSSVQALRVFINQRLTAAAGEIFTVFEQTMVQFEEEIVRQRKLLQVTRTPQIELHTTELQQHHDCREEQLFKQETNYCLEQEEPEPPQIKEEPEEPGLLQFKVEQEQPESPQIEEQEELGTSQEGEATINVELEKICIYPSDCVDNVPVSEKQDECEMLLCEETCCEIAHESPNLCQNYGTVTDKKKMRCELCGRSFNQQSNLLRHMRTHMDDELYSCEICGKSFSRHSNLLDHVRSHTGPALATCSNTPLPQDDGLWILLESQDVAEENIETIQQDHVDDSSPAAFIPAYARRIAVKRFCLEKQRNSEEDPKRLSMFEKLQRKKAATSSRDKGFAGSTKFCLRNNKRAIKTTRKIELGWIHDNTQVRKRKGGGTRSVDISKKATKKEILQKARDIFFPNEQSSKGKWEEFSHDIVDFRETRLDEDVSVGELYETQKLGRLRFYLSTECPVKTSW